MSDDQEIEKRESDDDKSDPIMGDSNKSFRMTAYWKSEIEAVDQEQERWHKKGGDILKRFRDERKESEKHHRKLNILWSNVQTLKPALYGKRPNPIAERRFLDHDPKGRTSAIILERTLRNEIEENGYHEAVSLAVDDKLLPGRGQVWVRYEPEFGESVSLPGGHRQDMSDAQGDIEPPDESPEEEKLESTGEDIIAETVPVDHINWTDFYMFPAKARTWKEVQAVGKRVFMSKSQCIERFGEKIGNLIQADNSLLRDNEKHGNTDTAIFQDLHDRQRIVYEIWNKEDRKVYWVSTGYEYLCDCRPDPLKLKHFFPCPEPLSSTMTNETMIPVPDYMEYQDQAIQADELTNRISMLTSACKVAGVYDASARGNRGGLDRLLEESVENQLIPVESYAAFAEKGGLKGVIDFLPLDVIVKALEVLIEVRAKVLEDLDRVTGVADLMRGTTDARETLGAQRLKSNYNGTRLDAERDKIGRFARDVLRIVAEIACKHFADKTLIEKSGIFQEEGIASLMEQLGGTDALDQLGGGAGSPPSPQGAPLPMAALPPPSPMPPGGAMPGQPPPMGGPGGNVVPFHPPGAPGMPTPGQQPGMQPQQMQPPKPSIFDIIKKIKGALELLRKDVPRGYRIDIETDTMIAGDAAEERENAVEFTEAMIKFLEVSAMAAAQQPQAVPLFGKMLQFVVRKFRSGRDLEAAVDEYVDKVEKMAQSGGMQQKQDPQQMIAMIKMQTEQQKAQAEIGKAKLDAQTAQQQDQRDQQMAMLEYQLKQKEAQNQMMLEDKRLEMEQMKMQIEREKLQNEHMFNQADHQRKSQFADQQHQMKLQQMAIQQTMPKPAPKEAAE